MRHRSRSRSNSVVAAASAVMLAALGLAIALSAVPARAQGGPPESRGPAHGDATVDRVLEKMKARLKLTPEQEKQLRPILEENGKKLQELRQKYFAKTQGRPAPPDPEMQKELTALRDDNDRRITRVLTPAQVEEWHKMQAEARQRLQQRMQGGANTLPPPQN